MSDSDNPTPDATPDAVSPPLRPGVQHPTQVGPYRIIKPIGEGGMGVVYAAEQLEPVRRQVALKMVRVGMDSGQVLARFDAERQALAVMEHPGIAKVLDGGVSEDGRPYFVMELVRGIRIDEYCDRFRLSTRRRLDLFIQLCQAVQHAHQKGVIHRDLKPTNILVTERDGVAVPKVIDFGIAKALGQRLTDATLLTTLGQALGTLAYMSPEQAEGSELDIDTRADIFSLGVILYELLVGSLPMDPKQTGIPSFLAQLITRDTSLPTLSSRLDVPAVEALASARGTDPASLRKVLRGDIQWIVMMAVDKDRGRRYATANALALDLGRYLDNEPVRARPPTATYRLGKFARRHKASVVAGIVALVALAGGAVAASVGLIRAREAEAEALAAEARAQSEAETARQVSDFLVHLFEVSDPGEARGSSVTAREVLDRGARRVESELSDQPLVQARMMTAIGAVFRGLGLYDDALGHLARGLTLREANLPPQDPEVAESLYELGLAQGAHGDLEAAETSLSRALAIREDALDPESDAVAHSLLALGGNHLRRGSLDIADSLLNRALQIEELTPGADHPEEATVLADLGVLALYRGEFSGASQRFMRAIGIRERLLGEDHPDLAGAFSNLGASYFYLERYDDALEAYERSLEIWTLTLEPDHPRLATPLLNIGEVHAAMGKPDEAEPMLLRALELKERSLSPDDPSIAETLKILAGVYRAQGRYGLSESHYRRAIQIMEGAFGADHRRLASFLDEYATMLREAGRDDEAARLAERRAALGGGG